MSEVSPDASDAPQKAVQPVSSAVQSETPAVVQSNQVPVDGDQLPFAAIIYGMAASALFVVGVVYILRGVWFSGVFIFLVAGCFLGFALYSLKNSGNR